MTRLSKVERAALLRCRYAGRYDDLQNPNRERGTPDEYAEESAASRVKMPRTIFLDLVQRGLLTNGPRLRLTEAGREALRTTQTRDET